MNLLGQSAFLKALGWALLGSLWQFGLLWIIYLVLSSILKKLSSHIKHGLALFFITLGFVWFVGELSLRYFYYAEVAVSSNTGYLISNNIYLAAYLTAKKFLESNISLISLIYLLVVAALSIKFFRYFNHSIKIQTKGLSKLNLELRLYIQQLVEQFGIRRKVQVWISEYIDTPMVIGLIKPTILIPFACVNHLSVKQMEAVLLHELAHIKRNDYLINLYVATLEILFFFNPFTRLLIQSIRQERENSCDDWVIQFRFDRHQYASALLALEKNRSTYYPLSVAATGESNKILLRRIERIMNVKHSESKKGFTFPAYIFMILLLGFIALVNPGNMVLNKLSNDSSPNRKADASIKNTFVQDNHRSLKYANKISLESIKPTKKIAKDVNLTFTPKPPNSETISAKDHDPDFLISTNMDEEISHINHLNAAISVEQRAFSLPEKDEPELPAAAIVEQFPFVPRSSFLHFLIDDTTKPRDKIQTYQERTARESLAKAQKALETLNWEKIEVLIKNKVDITRLRKEIQHSLEQLNWQKINEEVKENISKEATEKLKSTLKAEYEQVKNYRNQLHEYQIIKDELQLQQEIYKRDAEIKLIEIQKQAQKRKNIVVI